MMQVPKEYASGDNLEITHYLVSGCVHISQCSELHVVMDQIYERRNNK